MFGVAACMTSEVPFSGEFLLRAATVSSACIFPFSCSQCNVELAICFEHGTKCTVSQNTIHKTAINLRIKAHTEAVSFS